LLLIGLLTFMLPMGEINGKGARERQFGPSDGFWGSAKTAVGSDSLPQIIEAGGRTASAGSVLIQYMVDPEGLTGLTPPPAQCRQSTRRMGRVSRIRCFAVRELGEGHRSISIQFMIVLSLSLLQFLFLLIDFRRLQPPNWQIYAAVYVRF
jgi:hypothetical protein